MAEIRLEALISDFKTLQTNVCEWDSLELKSYDVKIFYTLKNQKKGGFYFYGVEQVAVSGHKVTKKNPWHPAHCSVECLFYGEAKHDGIKDFWMGNHQTDNVGYQRYIDLDQYNYALESLRKLEKKHCFTDQ